MFVKLTIIYYKITLQAICRILWGCNVGSNFIFCKFDPSFWFPGQVRSNDAWQVWFLSQNFSVFNSYYITLVHNKEVAWGTPEYALIFNFLDFLETLWTKLKFQRGSIWFFWLLAHHYISKNTLMHMTSDSHFITRNKNAWLEKHL